MATSEKIALGWHLDAKAVETPQERKMSDEKAQVTPAVECAVKYIFW